MIDIFPNTEVRLLFGCPIEKSHANTIFFTSSNEQVDYFNRFRRRVFYNVSYQRENRNVFRIECPIEYVIDCNYMMFKNSSFENKWFFAFVNKINYVNPTTTEVEYEIDVLQSWYFNFDFHQSFVEREHTLDDNFGKHIMPEPLTADNYITHEKVETDTTSDNWKYVCRIYYVPNNFVIKSQSVIAARNSYDPDNKSDYLYEGEVKLLRCNVKQYNGHTVDNSYRKGSIKNNVYEGFDVIEIPIITADNDTLGASLATIGFFLNRIVREEGNIDAQYPNNGYDKNSPINIGDTYNIDLTGNWGLAAKIVDVVIVPLLLVDYNYLSYHLDCPNSFYSVTGGESVFVPRNNKTRQYPFQKIVISNNDGTKKEILWENFKWEWSQSLNKYVYIGADFRMDCALYPSPSFSIYPKNYNGIEDNFEEGISLDPEIACTWSEDSYAKWYNANKNKIDTQAITSALKAGLGVALIASGYGTVFGAAMALNAGSQIASTVSAIEDKKKLPDELYGSYGSDGIKIIQKRKQFYIYSQQVKAEQAKVIDDFFTMYGYQVNELKIPNVFNHDVFSQLRPCWNYVKTQNAVITPKQEYVYGLPAEAEQKICEIFNNGVTFWNKNAIVGDYSANNSPVI